MVSGKTESILCCILKGSFGLVAFCTVNTYHFLVLCCHFKIFLIFYFFNAGEIFFIYKKRINNYGGEICNTLILQQLGAAESQAVFLSGA